MIKNRSVSVGVGKGYFTCPKCQARRQLREVSVHEAVTVLGLPVLPRGRKGGYIECQTCKSTYDSRVLQGQSAEWGLESEQDWAARRVMVLMMLADGHVDEAEIVEVQRCYFQLTQQVLTRERVNTEIEHCKADQRGVEEVLDKLSATLNAKGKEVVLQSACMVAAADGQIQKEEVKLMYQLGRALELPKQRIDRALQNALLLVTQPGPPPREHGPPATR